MKKTKYIVGIVIGIIAIIAGLVVAFLLPRFTHLPHSYMYYGYAICAYGVIMIILSFVRMKKNAAKQNSAASDALPQSSDASPQAASVPISAADDELDLSDVTYRSDNITLDEDSGLFFERNNGDLIELVKNGTGKFINLGDSDGGEYSFKMLWRGVETHQGFKRLYCALQSNKQKNMLYVLFVVKGDDGLTALYLDGADENRETIIERLNAEYAGEDESAEEIDISKEERPQGKRFGKKWFPSKAWFSDNGIPVKEIPVDKKVLKNLDEEQKYVIALATFSVARIKAILILFFFAACVIIGVTVSVVVGGFTFAFVLIAIFIVGGFIVSKTARLLDGFDIVNGTFKDRIGCPFYWTLIFAAAAFVGAVWSFFPTFIYILFDMTRREKMTSLPRVAVPQNCEMDDMISVYSAYERACSIDDAFNQASAAAAKRSYDRKQSELDSLGSKINSDAGLSAADKQELLRKKDEIKRQNEDTYNNNIDPFL